MAPLRALKAVSLRAARPARQAYQLGDITAAFLKFKSTFLWMKELYLHSAPISHFFVGTEGAMMSLHFNLF